MILPETLPLRPPSPVSGFNPDGGDDLEWDIWCLSEVATLAAAAAAAAIGPAATAEVMNDGRSFLSSENDDDFPLFKLLDACEAFFCAPTEGSCLPLPCLLSLAQLTCELNESGESDFTLLDAGDSPDSFVFSLGAKLIW